jgi:hypothetical protein
MVLEKFIKEAEGRGSDEKCIMDLPAVIAP